MLDLSMDPKASTPFCSAGQAPSTPRKLAQGRQMCALCGESRLSTLRKRSKGAHAALGVPRASGGGGETPASPNKRDSAGSGECRERLNLLRLVRDARLVLGGPVSLGSHSLFPVTD